MEKDYQKEIKKNKKLLSKYPWLWPYDLNLEPVSLNDYDYSWTILDELPYGWVESFGTQMCEEIQKILKKHHCTSKFRILQAKEKFGALRIYFNGVTAKCNNEIREILRKYEELSSKTCYICGKPAKWISRGWICPYCDDCAKKNAAERHKAYINPEMIDDDTMELLFYKVSN